MDSMPIRMGELQLRIMQVLWTRRAASVSQVHAQLGGELAYTTVATMLRKMEERQLVDHREEGRRFVYRALLTPQQVSTPIASDLVDRVFDGSLSQAFQHLLETRDVAPDELARLEELLQEHRQSRRPRS